MTTTARAGAALTLSTRGRACVRVRAWTCAGVRVRVRAVSGNTSPKLIQIAYISISPLTKNPNHHELTP